MIGDGSWIAKILNDMKNGFCLTPKAPRAGNKSSGSGGETLIKLVSTVLPELGSCLFDALK
jgi:hypothetical protein